MWEASFCARRYELRESEISYVVMISRVQYMSKWTAVFSLSTGFTIAKDYQGQPGSQGLLYQYDVTEFKDSF